MVNEVLQWVVLVIIGVLVLGILRQIALAQPLERRANTTSGPAVGKRLPTVALTEIRHVLDRDVSIDNLLVAFVVESCAGCQRLLAELTEPGQQHLLQRSVLVARQPSPQFRQALEEVGVPTIFDEGEIWEACGITNTPMVVKIDGDGHVKVKGVTHRVDKVAAAAS